MNTTRNIRAKYNIEIRVDGTAVPFRIDTGADLTVINQETWERLKRPCPMKTTKRLLDAGGRLLNQEGMITSQLDRDGKAVQANLFIIPEAPQNLLGMPEIESLGIIHIVPKVVRQVQAEEEYQELYGALGQLPEKYTIKLRENVQPFALQVPRRLPIGLRDAAEKELMRMVELGVIERVEEHREWCAGMVVAPKASGDVRICVDLTVLNKSVLRENYPLPRVEELLANLEGSKIFSKMDANSGFWQIELAEESRQYTTFITPFGRFQFRKMPFGISAAPEFFQRQMSRILEGLEGTICMMDDILVHGRDVKEHDERLLRVLQRIKSSGMTLNKKKCQFRVKELIFLGHKISGEGISPDPNKVRAIREMRAPTNQKELRSFLGMVNFLHKFSHRLAELEKPLRELGKKNSPWSWEESHQRSFEALKREISNAPVLAKYDVRAKHRLTADSSCYALGAALLQETETGGWQPVAFVSRKLTIAEIKYAQLEKEALAITWACERFDFFLVGTHFEVETDHKPLVKLLGESDLSGMPLRCQRFKLRLMRYSFTIFHTPGTQMFLADALSRPAEEVTNKERAKESRVEGHIRQVIAANEEYDDGVLQEIRRQGDEDETYQRVIKEVELGWPGRGKSYAGDLRKFYTQREKLTTKEGIVMREDKVVIPQGLVKDMLERIHRGHQGIEKCKRRAVTNMWWPNMRQDIEDYVNKCNVCIKERRRKHYPLQTSELPRKPWECVGSDLFEFKGRDYVIAVDYYSRWIEVAELANKTAEAVVKKLKSIFGRFGVPMRLRTDNGPCFSGDFFAEYVREYRIKHQTSSPHYPESNGLAERCVQTVKGMWKKESDKNLALMIYRATPLESGVSPAELLMARKIRTNIPTSSPNDAVDCEHFEEKDVSLKRRQKRNADRRRRAKQPDNLQEGDIVWVKCKKGDEGKRGIILKKREEPYSFDVRVQGHTVRRNRSHLKKLNPDQLIDSCSETEDSERGMPLGTKEERESEDGTDTSSETDSSSDQEFENPEEEHCRPIEAEQRRAPSRRAVSRRHLHPDCVYY